MATTYPRLDLQGLSTLLTALASAIRQGHKIIDSTGLEVTARDNLKFANATITDDGTNTIVTVNTSGSDASDIAFDNTVTETTETNVQDVIDNELFFIPITQARFDALSDQTAHNYFITDANTEPDAENVKYDNTTSGASSTDVQSAIDEIWAYIRA